MLPHVRNLRVKHHDACMNACNAGVLKLTQSGDTLNQWFPDLTAG
jgi:hypothetical protein